MARCSLPRFIAVNVTPMLVSIGRLNFYSNHGIIFIACGIKLSVVLNEGIQFMEWTKYVF